MAREPEVVGALEVVARGDAVSWRLAVAEEVRSGVTELRGKGERARGEVERER